MQLKVQTRHPKGVLFWCNVRNSSWSKLLPNKCDENLILGKRKRNERKGVGGGVGRGERCWRNEGWVGEGERGIQSEGSLRSPWDRSGEQRFGIKGELRLTSEEWGGRCFAKIMASSPNLIHSQKLRQLRSKWRNGSPPSKRFCASSTRTLGPESKMEEGGRETFAAQARETDAGERQSS